MKKLTEKQIESLNSFKDKGGIYVYKTIHRYFGSWYVRLFHVDNLLEQKVIPSYWYQGRGDCTMKHAEKQGYKCLYAEGVL